MKILITKDDQGFLAEVEWHENIFAHGETEVQARKELLSVVEMMMDYHSSLLESQKKMRETLIAQI